MSFSCTIMILFFFFQFLVFYMAFLHFYKVLFILLVAVSDRPFFLALGPMLLTTNQKISVLLLQVIQISIVTF